LSTSLSHSLSHLTWFSCLFSRPGAHRDLHSFPTRRSSDLAATATPPRRPSALSGGCTTRRARRRTGSSPSSDTATCTRPAAPETDRKSTRLNSSHVKISYAVFCLKKKKKKKRRTHSEEKKR